jgi:hypothetical protein
MRHSNQNSRAISRLEILPRNERDSRRVILGPEIGVESIQRRHDCVRTPHSRTPGFRSRLCYSEPLGVNVGVNRVGVRCAPLGTMRFLEDFW